MPFTYQGAGTGAGGTTSATPSHNTPLGGWILFLVTVTKYAYPTTPSGWTLLGQANGGSGASGVDTGTAYVCVFQKYAIGTEGTSTVTVTHTGGNSIYARIFQYFGDALNTGIYTFSASVGNFTTPGTAWSVTGDVDPGILGDDMVFVASAVNGNAYTYSAEALSTTGVTYGAANERADVSVSNGDDQRMVVSDHVVSSGTSSAAPVYTMTASGSATNSPAGATVMVRMREPTIGVRRLTSGSSGTDATSYTTASVTLTNGKNYLLSASGYQVSGATNTPTVSGWTQVDEIALLSSPCFGRETLFKKAGDGSTGTHTIDYGGLTMQSCAWVMLETTGFDEVTNVSKFASTTDGGADSDPLEVTYGSAFASASNFALAFFFTQNNRAATPRTNWYELVDQDVSDFTQIQEVQIKTSSDTIASVNWDFGNWDCVIAVELPITAAGGSSPYDPFGRFGFFGI